MIAAFIWLISLLTVHLTLALESRIAAANESKIQLERIRRHSGSCFNTCLDQLIPTCTSTSCVYDCVTSCSGTCGLGAQIQPALQMMCMNTCPQTCYRPCSTTACANTCMTTCRSVVCQACCTVPVAVPASVVQPIVPAPLPPPPPAILLPAPLSPPQPVVIVQAPPQVTKVTCLPICQQTCIRRCQEPQCASICMNKCPTVCQTCCTTEVPVSLPIMQMPCQSSLSGGCTCSSGFSQCGGSCCLAYELASGDVIYNVGSGGCTADTDCTDGKCDTSTGLCIPTAKPAASTAAPATAEFATSADSSENQRCPTNTGMTDTPRYKFLDMHNYRREILAKGTVQMKDTSTLPKAANMRRMRYNCGMEVKAVEYLKNCPGDASPVSARDGAGENFITISDTTITNYTAAIQKAVTSWWKVIRTTDGITMDVIYKSNYVCAQISSFTQMAWATTHKLGCAVAKCSTDYVAVCRYAPIGNNVQEAIYTIGDPCTVCPTDAWCTYDALCTLP